MDRYYFSFEITITTDNFKNIKEIPDVISDKEIVLETWNLQMSEAKDSGDADLLELYIETTTSTHFFILNKELNKNKKSENNKVYANSHYVYGYSESPDCNSYYKIFRKILKKNKIKFKLTNNKIIIYSNYVTSLTPLSYHVNVGKILQKSVYKFFGIIILISGLICFILSFKFGKLEGYSFSVFVTLLTSPLYEFISDWRGPVIIDNDSVDNIKKFNYIDNTKNSNANLTTKFTLDNVIESITANKINKGEK